MPAIAAPDLSLFPAVETHGVRLGFGAAPVFDLTRRPTAISINHRILTATVAPNPTINPRPPIINQNPFFSFPRETTVAKQNFQNLCKSLGILRAPPAPNDPGPLQKFSLPLLLNPLAFNDLGPGGSQCCASGRPARPSSGPRSERSGRGRSSRRRASRGPRRPLDPQDS